MAKFVCTVCGYVYEGDAAPEKCPVCGVEKEYDRGDVLKRLARKSKIFSLSFASQMFARIIPCSKECKHSTNRK